MIRALRIALANWIMPKPVTVRALRRGETNEEAWSNVGKYLDQATKIMQDIKAESNNPPTWLQDDAKVVAAVKTFPGGLTVWPKP